MTTAYDELHEAWKREFHSSELQPLKQGLFKELASYIRRLRESQRNLDPNSLKAIVMNDEMQRLEQLVAQLQDRRLDKLKRHATHGQPDELDPTEKQSYQDLAEILRRHQKGREDLLQGREPTNTKISDKGLVLVRFVKDVPSIIGVDLKTHGPFLREDVANLPHENAESLVRQGAAVEISVHTQDNE